MTARTQNVMLAAITAIILTLWVYGAKQNPPALTPHQEITP